MYIFTMNFRVNSCNPLKEKRVQGFSPSRFFCRAESNFPILLFNVPLSICFVAYVPLFPKIKWPCSLVPQNSLETLIYVWAFCKVIYTYQVSVYCVKTGYVRYGINLVHVHGQFELNYHGSSRLLVYCYMFFLLNVKYFFWITYCIISYI